MNKTDHVLYFCLWWVKKLRFYRLFIALYYWLLYVLCWVWMNWNPRLFCLSLYYQTNIVSITVFVLINIWLTVLFIHGAALTFIKVLTVEYILIFYLFGSSYIFNKIYWWFFLHIWRLELNWTFIHSHFSLFY